MKKLITLLTLICLSFGIASAQFSLKKIANSAINKVENKVENRVDSRIDKQVDKGLDKTEQSIAGKSGNTKPETKKQDSTLPQQEKPAPVLEWAKYDFVPGTEIIFEDNQENEQNGEFPSKWDLAGGVFENAVFDGLNVIYIRDHSLDGGIIPLMKDASADYLPEQFTVEFDCYFLPSFKDQRYWFSFYAKKKQTSVMSQLTVYTGAVKYGTIAEEKYPGADGYSDKQGRWRHVAISFNKRALKVYLDDARVINLPNVEGNPTGITLTSDMTRQGGAYLKNIRIAKGAVPLYDKFITDGKFVTTGIKFDINKASIKPESMGTINYVVKMMTDHPDLKFSVEGHTDSDGDDALNMKLSEARAKAIRDKMVELGIDGSRLTSKGYGESKPITGNDTPEGKAQNRRVEFVKF